MKLINVAKSAADKINASISNKLTDSELEDVTGIIAAAMEKAVNKTGNRSIELCLEHVNPDTDIAHQIQKSIKRKQNALITNLSSLR